jgi:hypothetical protein
MLKKKVGRQLGILTPRDHTEKFHLTAFLIRARSARNLLASVVKYCRIHRRSCRRDRKNDCSYKELVLCIKILKNKGLVQEPGMKFNH